MSNAINCKNLNFGYNLGELILEDISFTVNEGECMALVGHNGTGKTTLIKLLIGIDYSNTGRIVICNKELNKYTVKEIHKNIGFVPENILLYPQLTGMKLMQYFARLKKVDSDTILPILKKLEIDYAANKKIGKYSKGMKQRLMLAQALLAKPKVLILDEPTSGLDPYSRKLLYKTLKSHVNEGNAVLLSSHVLKDLEPLADRIMLINKHKILLNDNMKGIISKLNLPTHIVASFTDDKTVTKLIKATENLATVKSQQNNSVKFQCDNFNKLTLIKIISSEKNLKDINIINPDMETVYHKVTKTN